MQRERPVRLILVSGTAFHGWSFGAREAASGEVIFNTAATGYRESLTDPSGKGQILTLIYHIIGNNEVPAHSETDVISDFFWARISTFGSPPYPNVLLQRVFAFE